MMMVEPNDDSTSPVGNHRSGWSVEPGQLGGVEVLRRAHGLFFPSRGVPGVGALRRRRV